MIAAAHLASKGNLPGDRLTAADDKIFGVYQDWVYQNPVTHLDGRIENYGRWKQICEKLICLPTQQYNVLYVRVKKRFVSTLTVELEKFGIEGGMRRGR